MATAANSQRPARSSRTCAGQDFACRSLATTLVVVDDDIRFGGVGARNDPGGIQESADMSNRFSILEKSLGRARFRWKWLKAVQGSLVLGTVVCLLVLLFGAAMLAGVISSRTVVGVLCGVLAALAGIAWAVILISVALSAPDRDRLASAMERADRRWLDRLNTLVFLERFRRSQNSEAFARRIAKQAQSLTQRNEPPHPAFPATPVFAWLGGFFLSLACVIALFYFASPWQRLLAAEDARSKQGPPPEKPLELAAPATNSVEQNLAWGEVRITEPGGDLKVTKVDVVPLQIEAAANQSLKEVDWYSTINGTEESSHELPPPAEPRYAVYQPTLFLDELKLSDWDVMTYYAKAKTEKENSYASEVYFLEVRPFREDILKTAGGEGGKAYQALSEMTSLIDHQQHVIRQTHQHAQKPLEQENLRSQDRRKLAEAESDLSDSARHLYAQMATEMENKPIGEALDNLAKAEKSLGDASKLLQQDVLPDAQNRERTALAELVAARKMFQKVVNEHPGDFGGDGEDKAEETPIAQDAKKLSEIAEFRNEARAAREFVQKTLEDQKALEKKTRPGVRKDYQKLAAEERKLQQSLHDFEQDHPKAFQGAKEQTDQADQAMSQVANALDKKTGEGAASQQAVQQLGKLSDELSNQAAGRELADAYRLKQMLDKQIQAFDQRSQPDSKISDDELHKTVGQTRETINQLKKVAEEEPTRDAFGPALRESLSGDNKVDIDSKLNKMERPQRLDEALDEAAKRQTAGEIKQALSKVSQAFGASEPKSLQMAAKQDSLKPGGQDSFNQGMAELESLMKQAQAGHSIPRSDQAKEGQEALFNLQTGMRELYGNNERGNQILVELDRMLKDVAPLDPAALQKLMDELQHFSVETSDHGLGKPDKPEVTNIDPSRLPPAYRGRIQKYFQKLSEK
jgi:hypothetical protein